MSAEELDHMIESLQRLSKVDVLAAKLAAPLVEAEVRKTAAAGTSPDGKAWPARKDGGRAMAGAAKHVKAEAVGRVVRVTLQGPDVFHHYAARGEPRRQVIPDPGVVPDGVARAVRAGVARAIAEAVK